MYSDRNPNRTMKGTGFKDEKTAQNNPTHPLPESSLSIQRNKHNEKPREISSASNKRHAPRNESVRKLAQKIQET